ncbi:hypothetical protein [Streptomyces sp. SID3212]|uniref:hypothetical protein n=1 Tax=Streptomyces sp. SID3212 TaxID=2690259 RepID=UPI00136D55BB|nr:hypothetical protein [Streptomyces sp. SID3212]MYV56064.1 hypothetical protein [Streptomyces sp. SID3212]
MSDEDDQLMIELRTGIGAVYAMLIAVCAALPIPVSLPTGVVAGVEASEAVHRLTELVREIPLPEEQLANLSAGATLWLCATDMLGLINGIGFVEYRAMGGTAMLLMAQESLSDLAHWQDAQGGGS